MSRTRRARLEGGVKRLTFGDIANLEHALAEEARRVEPDEIEPLLARLSEWYTQTQQKRDPAVDGGTFALLCDYVRASGNRKVRDLALGALRRAARDSQSHLHRARFETEFALGRIRALTGETPLWSDAHLSERDRGDASALFEAAQGDRSYTDAALRAAVEAFVAEHQSDSSIFGRLASDLILLSHALDSTETDQDHRRTARAALTYFAVAADAVPDGRGLAGLLDDIFIVRRAVDEIHPYRGALSHLLDDVVAQWPFIGSLAFQAGMDRYAFSEFMIINSALLLESVSPSTSARGSALIVPDSGPLPFFLGFVTALSEIQRWLDPAARPSFLPGERLVNREGGGEAEFQAYCRNVEPCDNSAEATHFRFKTTGKRGSVQWRPIAELACFRRVADDRTAMRRGRLLFDPHGMTIGPLERLFGSVEPILLPKERGRTLVVGPLSVNQTLAEEHELWGTPLVDVIPMGKARVVDDRFDEEHWTSRGVGGRPLLVFLRTSAEAAEMVDDSQHDVVSVIAAVKPNSIDAVNLARIASRDVPVVAILDEGDTDAQDHLSEAGFRVWTWDERWFGSLRWPPRGPTHRRNALENYERRLVDAAKARLTVERRDLPELDNASIELSGLETRARAEDNEMLDDVIVGGFGLLVRVCRCVDLLTGPAADEMQTQLAAFIERAKAGKHWWSDEVVASVERLIHCLQDAVARLSEDNPKRSALLAWSASHPSGVVLVDRRTFSESGSLRESSQVRLVRQLDRDDVPAQVLIPAWLGRDHMARLLHPPVAGDVTLLLYGPERAWYGTHEGRRSATRNRLSTLAAKQTAFPRLANRGGTLPPPPPSARVVDDEPDEFIVRARRAHAMRILGRTDGETVRAHLVNFAGGYWAAFATTRIIHTVTHLVVADEKGSEDGQLVETIAADLKGGDLVLLLRGSDRDALRDAVDAQAPPGARGSADIWRGALRRRALAGSSLDSLVDALSRAGCRRTPATVRRWIEDEDMIGPRYGDRDIDAIVTVTRDEQLTRSLATCKGAITLLRGLHSSVGRTLAKQVLKRAREWIDAGAEPNDLIHIEDRLVVVSVNSVDPQPVDVPRGSANRLQETRWLG